MRHRNIFLNYRRDDTAGYAGRLFDRLNRRFPGRVFRDVTSVTAGTDFVTEIKQKLDSCDALIVLIGRQWLTLEGPEGRRIDDEHDFVRLEVVAGLRRGIPVIPVLVGGAPMPRPADLPEVLRPLANRNAIEMTEPNFDHDVERLIASLKELMGGSRAPWKKLALAGVGAVAALVAVLAIVPSSGAPPAAPSQSAADPTPGAQPPTPVTQLASPAAEKKKEPTPTPAQTPEGQKAVAPEPTVRAPFDPVGGWRISARHDKSKIHFQLRLAEGGEYERRAPYLTIGKWKYDPATRTLTLPYMLKEPDSLVVGDIHEGHYHARWFYVEESKQRSEEVDMWRRL